jgi:hypothetical protein
MGSQGDRYEAAIMFVPIPVHREFALGFFRSTVFFFAAIAAFSESDTHTRTILVSLLFVIDAVSWHLSSVIVHMSNSVYNRTWLDTLTNRLAFEKFVERYRAGSQIEVNDIIQSATIAAREDVGKYLSDSTLWYAWGGFRKTLWGIGSFLWMWVSYGIFYGIAGAIGSSLRTGF